MVLPIKEDSDGTEAENHFHQLLAAAKLGVEGL